MKTRIIRGRTKKEIITQLSEPTLIELKLAQERESLARMRERHVTAPQLPEQPAIASTEQEIAWRRILREHSMTRVPGGLYQMFDPPTFPDPTIMGMRIVVDSNVPPDRVRLVQEANEAHMNQQSYDQFQEAIRDGRAQAVDFSNIRAVGPVLRHAIPGNSPPITGRRLNRANDVNDAVRNFSEAYSRIAPSITRSCNLLVDTLSDLTGMDLRLMQQDPRVRQTPGTEEIPRRTRRTRASHGPNARHRADTCQGCRHNQGISYAGTSVVCGANAGRVVPNERCRGYLE